MVAFTNAQIVQSREKNMFQLPRFYSQFYTSTLTDSKYPLK